MARIVWYKSNSDEPKKRRIIMGLRQIDLASKAEVNIVEVTALEKGRCVRLKRANKIFIILGLPILTEDSKGVFIRG